MAGWSHLNTTSVLAARSSPRAAGTSVSMFQVNCDFEQFCCAVRDLDLARSLNPALQTFDAWLARNAGRIALTT